MGDADAGAGTIRMDPPAQMVEVTGDRVAAILSPPRLVPGEEYMERRTSGKI
jgi:hypothetical protein